MTDWDRDYDMLAFGISRLGGGVLIHRGSTPAEVPSAPQALAEQADRMLESAPAPHLAAQVRAMRAVARYLGGERLPLAEYARECLSLEPRRLPESVFEEAHEELAAALPRAPGSTADRLRAWQAAHTLEPIERLPGLVADAVAETRARTRAIVPLPDEVVECRLVEGVSFHAAGEYEGGLKSTIHINRAIPFNLADLLYVVAHEGHPGHIAESMLKESTSTEGLRARFMPSPPFVLSEGLGLLAEEILFPGDEAQVWLNRHIFPKVGIRPDGSDLASIHHAKNVLWGVWGNAAFLADEGASDAELVGYLTRWALYSEEEAASALGLLRPSPMSPYVFGYFHGWELLRPWVTGHDRVRRLLTEHLIPASIGAADDRRGGDHGGR